MYWLLLIIKNKWIDWTAGRTYTGHQNTQHTLCDGRSREGQSFMIIMIIYNQKWSMIDHYHHRWSMIGSIRSSWWLKDPDYQYKTCRIILLALFSGGLNQPTNTKLTKLFYLPYSLVVLTNKIASLLSKNIDNQLFGLVAKYRDYAILWPNEIIIKTKVARKVDSREVCCVMSCQVRVIFVNPIKFITY